MGCAVSHFTNAVVRSGTDIERAIQVAVGTFPSAEQRRIVLLSDGRENLGSAREEDGAENEHGKEAQGAVDKWCPDPLPVRMIRFSCNGPDFFRSSHDTARLSPLFGAEEGNIGEVVVPRSSNDADIGA